jgi:DNA mismatch repair protein MutS
MVEMQELRNILKKANRSCMVIGDEIARGSEHLSGSYIVAAAIIRLSKLGAKFLFATQLHDLIKIEKSLENLVLLMNMVLLYQMLKLQL